MFEDKRTYEVHYSQFLEVMGKLTATYARIYDALHKDGKRVIKVFSACDTFSMKDAAKFLHDSEARKVSQPKSKKHIPLGTFKRLAEVVNRFSIFTTEISGGDLYNFRECSLKEPLQTNNVSDAAFFFSLLANHNILPNDWAKRAATHKQLYNAKKKNYPSGRYLRNAASRQFASLLAHAKYYGNNRMDFDLHAELASHVKSIVES